jgi:hypothetical protein
VNPADAWVEVQDLSDVTWLAAGILSAGQVFHLATYTKPVGENITNVRLWLRHKEGAGALPTTETALYIGASYYKGAAWHSNVITENYTDYATNPDTGLPWTEADINAAQFGFFGRCNRLYPDPTTYEVWIQVTSSAGVVSQPILLGDGLTETLISS